MLLIYKLRVGKGLCDILQKGFLLLKEFPPPHPMVEVVVEVLKFRDDSKFVGSQYRGADCQEILGLY
jgi:hypothetical protein